ncbi:uncharacterized protein LOC144139428 [Haemaphysalis longicornis]
MDNPGYAWEGEQLGASHSRSLPPPLCPAPAAGAERRTPPSRFVCLRCVSFSCPVSYSSTRGRRVDAVSAWTARCSGVGRLAKNQEPAKEGRRRNAGGEGDFEAGNQFPARDPSVPGTGPPGGCW